MDSCNGTGSTIPETLITGIIDLCWSRIRRLCIEYYTKKKEYDAYDDVGDSASVVEEQQTSTISGDCHIELPASKRLRMRLDMLRPENERDTEKTGHLTTEERKRYVGIEL